MSPADDRKGWRTLLDPLLHPDILAGSAPPRFRARVLVGIAAGTLPLLLILALFQLSGLAPLALANFIAVSVAQVVVLALVRVRGAVETAGIALVLAYLTSAVAFLLVPETHRLTILVYLPLLPVMAVFFASRRPAMWVAAVTVVAIGATLWGVDTPVAPATRSLFLASDLVGGCLYGLAVAWLIDVSRDLYRQELFQTATEAARLKEEFLSTASHELRTPATSLIGSVKLLRTHPAPAEADRLLQIAERSAVRLTELIEDLLLLQRADIDPSITLDPGPVDLVELTRQALRDGAMAFPGAEQTTLEVEPGVGPVVADARRVRQVIDNLLSNAWKYAAGAPPPRVSVRADGDGVRWTLRDHGPGVPPDFSPFLFEPFRRADQSLTRRVRGSGLGLSVCRHLIEAHGGRIGHESPADGGAVFWFHIPPSPRPIQGR